MLKKSTGNKFKLMCNEPGCTSCYGEPFYLSELKGAASSARMHGWHIYKTKAGNWQHICPKHDDDDGGRRKPKPKPSAPAAPTGRFYWQDN